MQDWELADLLDQEYYVQFIQICVVVLFTRNITRNPLGPIVVASMMLKWQYDSHLCWITASESVIRNKPISDTESSRILKPFLETRHCKEKYLIYAVLLVCVYINLFKKNEI